MQGLREQRFEAVGQVDAVLDLVGGEAAAQAEIRSVNMVAKRSAADLLDLAGFEERGGVKPRMGDVFLLELRARYC